MGKEIKDKININSVDVFFIGEDLSIFHSLKSLSCKLDAFSIDKTNFSKNITTSSSFFLIDDSLDNFNINYIDYGCYVNKDCDYADYIKPAVDEMGKDIDFVLGFCRTGQGVNIFANTFKEKYCIW